MCVWDGRLDWGLLRVRHALGCVKGSESRRGIGARPAVRIGLGVRRGWSIRPGRVVCVLRGVLLMLRGVLLVLRGILLVLGRVHCCGSRVVGLSILLGWNELLLLGRLSRLGMVVVRVVVVGRLALVRGR